VGLFETDSFVAGRDGGIKGEDEDDLLLLS